MLYFVLLSEGCSCFSWKLYV